MQYAKYAVLLTLLVDWGSYPEVCLGEVTSIGPIPYFGTADSPLLADPALDMVLEDFEDGLLDVLGIVVNPIENEDGFPPQPFVNDGRGIVAGPGPGTDSVDADDGIIDGQGNEGHAFRSTASTLFLSGLISNSLSYSFLPNAEGAYPNAFGFVWTDGEPGPDPHWVGFTGFDIFVRELHDTVFTHFNHIDIGDDTFDGSTGEDRFFGVYSDVGIASVGLSLSFVDKFAAGLIDDPENPQLFFEIDHLQFGYNRVPEPGTLEHFTIDSVVSIVYF